MDNQMLCLWVYQQLGDSFLFYVSQQVPEIAQHSNYHSAHSLILQGCPWTPSTHLYGAKSIHSPGRQFSLCQGNLPTKRVAHFLSF